MNHIIIRTEITKMFATITHTIFALWSNRPYFISISPAQIDSHGYWIHISILYMLSCVVKHVFDFICSFIQPLNTTSTDVMLALLIHFISTQFHFLLDTGNVYYLCGKKEILVRNLRVFSRNCLLLLWNHVT